MEDIILSEIIKETIQETNKEAITQDDEDGEKIK